MSVRSLSVSAVYSSLVPAVSFAFIVPSGRETSIRGLNTQLRVGIHAYDVCFGQVKVLSRRRRRGGLAGLLERRCL